MGVWVRGLVLALGVLVACAPLPGEEGGPINYVSTYEDFWVSGERFFWSIEKDDRVTFSRFHRPFNPIRDTRISIVKVGSYAKAVSAMEASNIEVLVDYCYRQGEIGFDDGPQVLDNIDSVLTWKSSNSIIRATGNDCDGGVRSGYWTIKSDIETQIKSIVEEALGLEP